MSSPHSTTARSPTTAPVSSVGPATTLAPTSATALARSSRFSAPQVVLPSSDWTQRGGNEQGPLQRVDTAASRARSQGEEREHHSHLDQRPDHRRNPPRSKTSASVSLSPTNGSAAILPSSSVGRLAEGNQHAETAAAVRNVGSVDAGSDRTYRMEIPGENSVVVDPASAHEGAEVVAEQAELGSGQNDRGRGRTRRAVNTKMDKGKGKMGAERQRGSKVGADTDDEEAGDEDEDMEGKTKQEGEDEIEERDDETPQDEEGAEESEELVEVRRAPAGNKSKLEIRREKNRVKQRNLRERRANHIHNLEASVSRLQAELSSVRAELHQQVIKERKRRDELEQQLRRRSAQTSMSVERGEDQNRYRGWVSELEVALRRVGGEVGESEVLRLKGLWNHPHVQQDIIASHRRESGGEAGSSKIGHNDSSARGTRSESPAKKRTAAGMDASSEGQTGKKKRKVLEEGDQATMPILANSPSSRPWQANQENPGVADSKADALATLAQAAISAGPSPSHPLSSELEPEHKLKQGYERDPGWMLPTPALDEPHQHQGQGQGHGQGSTHRPVAFPTASTTAGLTPIITPTTSSYFSFDPPPPRRPRMASYPSVLGRPESVTPGSTSFGLMPLPFPSSIGTSGWKSAVADSGPSFDRRDATGSGSGAKEGYPPWALGPRSGPGPTVAGPPSIYRFEGEQGSGSGPTTQGRVRARSSFTSFSESTASSYRMAPSPYPHPTLQHSLPSPAGYDIHEIHRSEIGAPHDLQSTTGPALSRPGPNSRQSVPALRSAESFPTRTVHVPPPHEQGRPRTAGYDPTIRNPLVTGWAPAPTPVPGSFPAPASVTTPGYVPVSAPMSVSRRESDPRLESAARRSSPSNDPRTMPMGSWPHRYEEYPRAPSDLPISPTQTFPPQMGDIALPVATSPRSSVPVPTLPPMQLSPSERVPLKRMVSHGSLPALRQPSLGYHEHSERPSDIAIPSPPWAKQEETAPTQAFPLLSTPARSASEAQASGNISVLLDPATSGPEHAQDTRLSQGDKGNSPPTSEIPRPATLKRLRSDSSSSASFGRDPVSGMKIKLEVNSGSPLATPERDTLVNPQLLTRPIVTPSSSRTDVRRLSGAQPSISPDRIGDIPSHHHHHLQPIPPRTHPEITGSGPEVAGNSLDRESSKGPVQDQGELDQPVPQWATGPTTILSERNRHIQQSPSTISGTVTDSDRDPSTSSSAVPRLGSISTSSRGSFSWPIVTPRSSVGEGDREVSVVVDKRQEAKHGSGGVVIEEEEGDEDMAVTVEGVESREGEKGM